MNTPVYVCEGTCGAKISEEEYNKGLTACGADGCTLQGHAFTKMYECSECGKISREDKPHPHQ